MRHPKLDRGVVWCMTHGKWLAECYGYTIIPPEEGYSNPSATPAPEPAQKAPSTPVEPAQSP